MSRHKVIIFIGILVVCIFNVFLLQSNLFHQKFNSENWKAAVVESEDYMSLRWDMMNSLREDHNLIGMNKTEIVQLLGEPDSGSNTGISYNLGHSKRGINTATLFIIFDENKKVLRFSVIEG